MNTFITEKGTQLYYEVTYDLGGYNQFTSEFEPRGYSLDINRDRTTVSAFTELGYPQGAVRLFLHEVGRQSAKQEKIALDMITPELLQNIADRYSI